MECLFGIPRPMKASTPRNRYSRRSSLPFLIHHTPASATARRCRVSASARCRCLPALAGVGSSTNNSPWPPPSSVSSSITVQLLWRRRSHLSRTGPLGSPRRYSTSSSLLPAPVAGRSQLQKRRKALHTQDMSQGNLAGSHNQPAPRCRQSADCSRYQGAERPGRR